MTRGDYRRKAVLARIHTTLDSFYLRQEIDWDYDIRKLLDHILDVALAELEFGEHSRTIDRGLIIVKPTRGEDFEVGAGYRVDDGDLVFSRTIVAETLSTAKPVLYENASDDPRFANAESIKALAVVSVMAVPIQSEARTLGSIYLEHRDPSHIFTNEDVSFLEQFASTIAPYVKTALIHQEHVAEIRQLQAKTEGEAQMPNLLGRSRAMEHALDLARIAASVEKTVLITGESGSGKELLARAIHARSRRAEKKFVVVDCSGLTDSLLESELFGHVKGSFTGAIGDKAGAFEEADGGTLFLDEISDAPKNMQQQLRRVLQEGEIRRVGDTLHRTVDVRIICATNRNLPQEVESGNFIHDLYHRIHQFPIRMPSLRERREDIPTLVDHFLASSGGRKNPPVRAIEADALAMLVALDWRENNVRELRNVVELSVDLTPSDAIDPQTIQRTLHIRADSDTAGPADDARPDARAALDPRGGRLALDGEATRQLFADTPEETNKEDRPYYRMLREFSGKLIVESLRFTGWKLRPAARLLGVSPVKLRQDLRAYLVDAVGRVGPAAAAELLDMPIEQLGRKLADLGIEPESSESASERAPS